VFCTSPLTPLQPEPSGGTGSLLWLERRIYDREGMRSPLKRTFGGRCESLRERMPSQVKLRISLSFKEREIRRVRSKGVSIQRGEPVLPQSAISLTSLLSLPFSPSSQWRSCARTCSFQAAPHSSHTQLLDERQRSSLWLSLQIQSGLPITGRA
jgi:hypothetical protein